MDKELKKKSNLDYFFDELDSGNKGEGVFINTDKNEKAKRAIIDRFCQEANRKESKNG